MRAAMRQAIEAEGGRKPALAARPATAPVLSHDVGRLDELPIETLCLAWRNQLGGTPPRHLPRWLMARILAYRIQAQLQGDLTPATLRLLNSNDRGRSDGARPFQRRSPAMREGGSLHPGSILMREWQGGMEQVMVLDPGFAWQGRTYASLSAVAKAITGTSWNGHRFFGLARQAPAPRARTGHSLTRSPAESGR